MIQLKRVYETPMSDEGLRILVERLWPRGVSKERAKLDFWMKEISPSSELRKWYGHDPTKWEQFRERYWSELESNSAAVDKLRKLIQENDRITFVYAAKDEEHNSAVVLKEFVSR